MARTLATCVAIAMTATAAAVSTAGPDDWTYTLTEEQYYAMPALYHLDAYDSCISRHQLYCLGSFQLSAAGPHQLFTQMQRYSTNFVDRFDHTQLHRGACVSHRCPLPPQQSRDADPAEWFESCINSTMSSQYNLSASLHQLEYCRRGGPAASDTPLSASERGFAALVAAILALAAVSTVLDLTLPDHAKKGAQWTLAWSLPGCWRALHEPPSTSADDLRVFDGVRVVCMLCVIIEHVVWLAMLSYNSQPRFIEEVRRSYDVMLLTNSTLIVQLFFCLSSFLLAHKLLQASGKETQPVGSTFCRTMVNRIIRISPSYYFVVWLAASWWTRLGGGPLWSPMVGAEAELCRGKWWAHLLYLNNVVYADDKCLIQTWYLAADMQLYAFCLLLTLALLRCRRYALPILCGMLAGVLTVLAGMAYSWDLVPTFILHRPEVVRAQYRGSLSFNLLYQSPLGNMPGALAGLILVHLHHAMLRNDLPPRMRQWFNWASWFSFPLGFAWVMLSPFLVPGGRPGAAAAALAVAERPVFLLLIGWSMLGALHGVNSPWGTCLSWSGWRTPARLSFAALLLHMPLNKSLLAARPSPASLDRPEVVFQWCGVALLAYLLALPLTLLVELPCQRLHRALTAPPPRQQPSKPTQHSHSGDNKTNH